MIMMSWWRMFVMTLVSVTSWDFMPLPAYNGNIHCGKSPPVPANSLLSGGARNYFPINHLLNNVIWPQPLLAPASPVYSGFLNERKMEIWTELWLPITRDTGHTTSSSVSDSRDQENRFCSVLLFYWENLIQRSSSQHNYIIIFMVQWKQNNNIINFSNKIF